MNLITALFVLALPAFALELSTMEVTGSTARELAANLGQRQVLSEDGELNITCSDGLCRILTASRPLRWDDDADGVPFSVEQVSLFSAPSGTLFQAMRPGTPVDPRPTMTGGVNPILEIRTFGSSDQTLFIQCERRRYTNECVIQKFRF